MVLCAMWPSRSWASVRVNGLHAAWAAPAAVPSCGFQVVKG
jgi:hypothetical protein